MAAQVPKKKPGKLKFNPAMFSVGAMKPGAKNPKLEALRQKRLQRANDADHASLSYVPSFPLSTDCVPCLL